MIGITFGDINFFVIRLTFFISHIDSRTKTRLNCLISMGICHKETELACLVDGAFDMYLFRVDNDRTEEREDDKFTGWG